MKRSVIVLLIIGFVAIAALSTTLFSTIAGSANTDATRTVLGIEDSCTSGVFDFNIKGFGAFPDARTDTRFDGEVFTQSTLYYSHDPAGQSEEIVVQAGVKRCNTAPSQWPDNVYYRFSINGNRMYKDDIPNGEAHFDLGNIITDPGNAPINFPAFSFKIDGVEYCSVATTTGCPAGKSVDIVDGSTLTVDVLAEDVGILGYPPILVMRDELNLRSALADVSFGKDGYVLGEDSVAIVNWDAPTATYDDCSVSGACTARPAYYLEVKALATNSVVYARKPITSASGQISILLSDSMFTEAAGCDNHLQATLYTEISGIDDDFTAVAKLGAGERPVVNSISLDHVDINEGETVSVSWEASGPITEYIVRVFIGGTEILTKRVSAATTSLTFQATKTGIGSVFVTALNECQPSDVKEQPFFVGNTYPGLCTVYPELPQCAGEIMNWLWVILLVIGALLVLGGLMIPMPWMFRLGAAGAGLVLILIGYLSAVGTL